jgi:hypothetical protein
MHVSGIPSQAGEFWPRSHSGQDLDGGVPLCGETPAIPPQVALRLALALAIEGKVIGVHDAISAMAAIEQLDQPSD